MKSSLAAAAALVVAGGLSLTVSPTVWAAPSECKPHETTAIVEYDGGPLKGTPYVVCVSPRGVTSWCSTEPGIPHTRLYPLGGGPGPECESSEFWRST